MKLPATLTVEKLADAYADAAREHSGPLSVSPTGVEAVAAIAIEHDRAEMLRAAGVDVEAVAREVADGAIAGEPGKWPPTRPERAFFTLAALDLHASAVIERALAPLAAERDRLAARVAELEAAQATPAHERLMKSLCDLADDPDAMDALEADTETMLADAARKGAQDG